MNTSQPAQFTCVARDGRGVLIAGPPGSGKTSLALALIDRGATLVGDDGVVLRIGGSGATPRLYAAPPPATRGLIELRNLGLVTMPVCEEVAVALLIRLDEAAPRFIEEAPRETLVGVPMQVQVPVVALWPDSPVLALRAEMALARHGLPA